MLCYVMLCYVMLNNWRDETEIKIGGSTVEMVEDFCHLGSFVTNNSSCDKDCKIRIGKANSVFKRLKPL